MDKFLVTKKRPQIELEENQEVKEKKVSRGKPK